MKLPVVLLVLVLGATLFFVGRCTAGGPETTSAVDVDDVPEDVTWTCPMHPQVQVPDPVPCPICGMDLVAFDPSSDVGERRIRLARGEARQAHVQTEVVTRRAVTKAVPMTGRVVLDPTRTRTVSTWVGGRIERMFVDYEGVEIRAGDHLFELDSPALLTAQEELLSAVARRGSTIGDTLYDSAREKLLRFGLSAEQIDAIEERGTAERVVTIYAPVRGTAVEKAHKEGDFVDVGETIYTIADLDRVWVELDAFEQDLAWVRFGQEARLAVEALPGETFDGLVAFVAPTVDAMTRVATVRVNVDNRDRRLKPGMYVRGVVDAKLTAAGRVVSSRLAGKWISPMHPEIVKDEPGTCDVCGMPLVRAEELGYVADESAVLRPIVVPESAVLRTGRRAIVYVEVTPGDEPVFEAREIALGPRAADGYVVFAGVDEGERVVVNGAFRLDSAMQIDAKPSLLSLGGDGFRAQGPEGDAFRESLVPLLDAYLALSKALSDDDGDRARGVVADVASGLAAVRGDSLPSVGGGPWPDDAPQLDAAVAALSASGDIEAMRVAFQPLSDTLLHVVRAYGWPADGAAFEAYCPMAFDDTGASWIQTQRDIENPYFGAAMYACGTIRETLRGGDR